jgi:hypothetical protein
MKNDLQSLGNTVTSPPIKEGGDSNDEGGVEKDRAGFTRKVLR